LVFEGNYSMVRSKVSPKSCSEIIFLIGFFSVLLFGVFELGYFRLYNDFLVVYERSDEFGNV